MEINRRELPAWCKEVKKALIDRDMGVKDLAEAIGLSREHVSAVINDSVRSPNAQERICSYLGVRAS